MVNALLYLKLKQLRCISLVSKVAMMSYFNLRSRIVDSRLNVFPGLKLVVRAFMKAKE